MRSRNYAFAVIALVGVALGLSWMLSNRAQHDQNPDTYPELGKVQEPAEPESFSTGTPELVEKEVARGAANDALVIAPPPEPAVWPTPTLEFAKQADPDPALSRYLETEMQRLMDTTLDRAKYDVTSVACRGHRCQVLTLDRSSAEGPLTPAIMSPVFRGMGTAGIRSPTSGADLKADLERVLVSHSVPPGIEFIVAFVRQ